MPHAKTDTTRAALERHLEHIALGDRDALGDLYDEIGPLVHRIASQIADTADAAETITIDTFVFVWRYAQRLNVNVDVPRLTAAVALRSIRPRC